MNGASDNNKTKQILVNSLEDINNPVIKMSFIKVM